MIVLLKASASGDTDPFPSRELVPVVPAEGGKVEGPVDRLLQSSSPFPFFLAAAVFLVVPL